MKRPIRALLLAAGFGTRLRPITEKTPKCLVNIDHEPILEKWLKKLEACNCSEVIVNTHYLSEQVKKYLIEREKTEMRIKCVYEPVLLGTAGTLKRHHTFFKDCTGLVIHADNYTTFQLNDLIKSHRRRPNDCLITMVTFSTNDPQSCGIVELDGRNIVQKFHEKVIEPPGNIANGAIYALDEEAIAKIKKLGEDISDISTQVLPKFVGKIYTYHTDKPFIDIGSPERLKIARESATRNEYS